MNATTQILSLIAEIIVDVDEYQQSNCEHDEATYVRLGTRLASVLERFSPPGSVYRSPYADSIGDYHALSDLLGRVMALRDDYQHGRLMTFKELISAELSSDYLQMASHLLQDERLKLPAAVLAGSVLEEHIRNLCTKHKVDVECPDSNGVSRPKKASTLNTDLKQRGAYNLNDQQQVTAWLAIRNDAAHGRPDNFDDAQVRLMIDGIRLFVTRFPA